MNIDLADMNVAIGLTNPKSPSNVGAALRAAGCYGADGVFYTGRRFEQAAKFHTDTQQAASRIPLLRAESFEADLPPGMARVCIELVEGAVDLPSFVHPARALYIFGPEDGSLKQSVVNAADAVVYIPTRGSMNLAATVNVLLYDRLAKQLAQQSNGDSDALIRASRDVNNRLRVAAARKPGS